jgi:hypothetical protein
MEEIPPLFCAEEELVLLWYLAPINICLSTSENIELPFCNSLSYYFFFMFTFSLSDGPAVLYLVFSHKSRKFYLFEGYIWFTLGP